MSEVRTAAQALAGARRVVVKIGSSLLVGSDGGVHRVWLADLAADIAALRAEGRQVAIVSSGAVALGLKRLGLRRSPRLDRKQAAAAAGQGLLMQAYDEALAPHGLVPAQLLLTYDDTERRRRWLNARATIEVLLAQGAVPIINENDSVATDELRYGDNDRLSARVAQMVRADLLVLLSDVDGLHTADPSRDPGAAHIPFVDRLTGEIEAMAGGVGAAGTGSGGMRTKLAAAGIAAAAGCATVIASGRESHPLERLKDGAKATLIAAETSVAGAYKQWISGTLATAGAVMVDEGAAKALASGRSLLAAGVRGVEGEFERGACVSVRDPAGAEIARGLVGYDADETRRVAGQASKALSAILGYDGPAELIHRNDLVMMRR